MACLLCGKAVERGPLARYCSTLCSNRAKWERQKSQCPSCGGAMSGRGASLCFRCSGRGAPTLGARRADRHGTEMSYKSGCRCDECKAYKKLRNREYAARRAAEGRLLHKSTGPVRPCAECGGEFQGRASRRFCSLDCAVRAQGGELGAGKSRDGRPRRYMTPDAREEFFAAAGWCCALCGDEMLPNVGYLHDLYPTLDHIVPRARGGSDDPSNLQPAHRVCNLRKGARDVSSGRPVVAA